VNLLAVSITGTDEVDTAEDENIKIYCCEKDSSCVNIVHLPVKSSLEMSENEDSFEWVADSASTVHITNRQDAFATYNPVPDIKVTGVRGVQVFAVGKGTVYLSSECDGKTNIICLNNVLHIPCNQNNLLSVIQWDKAPGRSAHFEDQIVTLNSNKNTTIAKGHRKDSKLYKIRFAIAPPPLITDNDKNIISDLICFSARPLISWEIWHKCFGHIAYSGLEKLGRLSLVNGLNIDTHLPKPDCIACMEAKLFEALYGPASTRETKVGELTHTDLWGKYDKRSINGNQYYLLLVDDAARHITVEFLKTKDQAVQRIKNYMTYLKARGASPCGIRMDRGTKFLNDNLRSWCHSEGIQLQLTAPYSPSQNGVAERMNRTLVELTRAMLVDSDLPEFLWEPAVAHAVYLWNMSYTTSLRLGNQTPYQVWYGKKPNISHLREFGAPVWVLLQGQNVQQKMLPKSQRRVYIRYNKGLKAIKFYNAATKNVLTARNYRFLNPVDPTPPEEIAIDIPRLEVGEQTEREGRENPPHKGGGEEDNTQKVIPKRRTASNLDSDLDPEEPCKTRGVRPDYKYMNDPFPDEEEAGIVDIREEAFAVIHDDNCNSLREAKALPEWPEWEQAIKTELDQLNRMGTWKLVEKPPGVIPIANKFVFTKKRDKDGKLQKYKARLVAKGCAQRPGYDFLEMHSPVVRVETIRLLLAVAAKRKLYIHQMDIKGAYLNGILKEKVYMKQPEGYGDGTGHICLLIKTLYGLKQAGREWNHEFDSKMRKCRYARLQSDPCVYVWHIGEDFAIIAVWVDDLLIFATTINLQDKAQTDVEKEWEVTDLGEPQKIIGIEITRTPESIMISSTRYIESILRKEGYEHCNSVSTPLDPNVQLVPNPNGEIGNRSNSFARLLGELQYVANATRPDISYAVNRLASYTANPSLQHTTALKRVLRYLSGTRSLGIVYKVDVEYPNFIGYTDASYANADERKSILGYVFIASGGAITWSSKKQMTKALSSMEAEYVAMSEAA